MANAVRFIYVPTGRTLPDAIERSRDAIYFVEATQQIFVGDKLLADHIDPVDLESYLRPYKIKSVEITGDGTFIASATFDESTGRLTLTRSTPPAIAKGVDNQPSEVALTPGSSFTVSNGTSVSDNKLYDTKTTYVMPAQISAISLERVNGTSNLKLTVVSTDGTSTFDTLTMFGDAAFSNVADYATRAQGDKADAAMPATNGIASDAIISLKRDPQSNMEAATKQYVDNAVSGLTGAMHLLGISTTAISNGERQHPTIEGSEIDTATLNPGDTVMYSPSNDAHYLEFVWVVGASGNGYWTQLGDETSYVQKTTRVVAGEGLAGGGALSSDATVSHGNTGSGSATTYESDTSTFSAITSVTVDKFGHVSSVSSTSFNSIVQQVIQDSTTEMISEAVADAIAQDETVAHIEDLPSWKVED